MNSRTTDPEESLARLGELARRALQAQADAAKQSIELGRAVLSPGADPGATGRAWAEAVGREGARYWREVGTLGMDVAGQVVTIGSRSVARVLGETQAAVDRTRRQRSSGGSAGSAGAAAHDDAAEPATGRPVAERRSAAANAAASPAPHVAVGLRAAPGGTATGTVVLANQHARARRVVLTPGEVLREPARDVALPVRVDPAGVTIPAHGEQTVTVEVAVPEDVVRSGERYVGEIQVTGGVEAVVDVVIDLD
ncbi:hypothetical protein [uncultured Phycicoccus sp.]|uniref:hypothetical protein n=1 Tax=uncultured Phycicoccus sp. TaxID=661422 RepID=UPI002624A843|nr:hypothetical protein [uncultured Phycicoccus sp.]